MASPTTRLDQRYLLSPRLETVDSDGTDAYDFGQNSNVVNFGAGNWRIGDTAVGATAAELNVLDKSASGLAIQRVSYHALAVFDTTETTTVTLPAGAIVLDVILNITDASGQSETINVGTAGTSNDPNGFFAAVPTNATIILSARDAVTKTTGSNETYISAVYGGALMYPGVINTVGTDANEDTGSFSSRPFYVATADPVTYTLSGTVTSFAASITVIYLDVS